MTTKRRTALFVSSIAALAILLALGLPGRVSAADESAATIIGSAHFAEPLVPTSSTSQEENEALAQALRAYQSGGDTEGVGDLTAFLSQYPRSGWAVALWTNLGITYLHEGYFSKAIDAWQNAWIVGKPVTEPRAKALVDRAVGELARLYASLGQNEELAALFAEIGDRLIQGSATEAVQTAREELTAAKKDPRHLFICGPLALRLVMMAEGVEASEVDFLRWYYASSKGTNLDELGHLADKVKFSHRLIFRTTDQPMPIPAVVHWKVGHFAAIVGKANGRFHVVDPVMAAQDIWMTADALDAESSGYFLNSCGGQRIVGMAQRRQLRGCHGVGQRPHHRNACRRSRHGRERRPRTQQLSFVWLQHKRSDCEPFSVRYARRLHAAHWPIGERSNHV